MPVRPPDRPPPFTIIHALEFRLQRMQEKLFAINRQTSNLPLAKTTKDVRRLIRSPLISERDGHDTGRQMQGMCYYFSFYHPDRPIRIWQDTNT